MLRDKVYALSILPNEDAEDEIERAERIESETWDGQHTEAFSRFVSKYPHDFLGEIVYMVKAIDDDAKLGRELGAKIETWVEEFAAEEAENV